MSTPQNNHDSSDSSRHSFPGVAGDGQSPDHAGSARTDGSTGSNESAGSDGSDHRNGVDEHIRDIAEVAAVEVVNTAAVHLMSAAAVKCGLADGDDAAELTDLDEARKLITALAGLITAAAPEIGSQHAGPLRDGLRSLQLAFREASAVADAPGQGPGEKFTGPVN